MMVVGMCEFKVILDNGKEKKQVAKNIIDARIREGKAILLDGSGAVIEVDSVAIAKVDTLKAEIVLSDGGHSTEVLRPISSPGSQKDAGLPDELKALKRFHGHLGPYLVLGYKMGKTAREIFPNRIYATLFSGSARPRSCMADGVQFSSCCTIGKSNIIIKEEGRARAMFTDMKTAFEINVLPSVIARIDEHMTHENEDEMSLEIYQEYDNNLFEVAQIAASIAWPGPQQR
jgi:formylmethanofuran dehydrogenase subunit E